MEDDQPSIRYLTLTELLDKPRKDPDVKSAKNMISQRGWAAAILSKQHPDGLNFMTAQGFADDRRLNYAISILKDKRRPDGRWNLDAVHPDLEGPIAELYARRPPAPFSLEPTGQPSKMITFLALRVLKRLGLSLPVQ